jgi:hypothetical protein
MRNVRQRRVANTRSPSFMEGSYFENSLYKPALKRMLKASPIVNPALPSRLYLVASQNPVAPHIKVMIIKYGTLTSTLEKL